MNYSEFKFVWYSCKLRKTKKGVSQTLLSVFCFVFLMDLCPFKYRFFCSTKNFISKRNADNDYIFLVLKHRHWNNWVWVNGERVCFCMLLLLLLLVLLLYHFCLIIICCGIKVNFSVDHKRIEGSHTSFVWDFRCFFFCIICVHMASTAVRHQFKVSLLWFFFCLFVSIFVIFSKAAFDKWIVFKYFSIFVFLFLFLF